MPEDLDLVVTVLDKQAVISVIGELDFHSAPRLREQILNVLNAGVIDLVIDLGQMDFVDSSGLGVLVMGLKRMRECDGSFKLRSPTTNTSKVLEISGLSKLLLVG
ncbi:MAG TPA: STAS domain-containing protein [Actinomycetota bacterium]|nr:STAS domain-containing protein [Actinomycetota bacterium]